MATRKRRHKKRSKSYLKKYTKGKRRKHVATKLPALSTLMKMPKRVLTTGITRLETALEMKESPGMFTHAGKRRFIGPMVQRGRGRRSRHAA